MRYLAFSYKFWATATRATAAVAVCLAVAIDRAGAQTKPADAAAADPMIAKVETGLWGRFQVLVQFENCTSTRFQTLAGDGPASWTLSERMAFHRVPGVSMAVIKDGKIAWAKGYGVLESGRETPVGPDTIFQAGSISKPVAAIAALRLVEQGKLSLDDPINDVLNSWKIPDNDLTKQRPVTLRKIMSHGAGLTVHGFPGYAAGMPVPTIQQILDGVPPANTAAVRVDKLPGASWRYSGGGYTIMQLAMTDVAGTDFPTLTEALILKPAGMTRSSYLNPLPETNRGNAATAHRRDGTPVSGHSHTYPEMAAAGLWTTPSDLSRLALAVVAAGRGDADAVLGPELTKQMLTTQIGTYGLGFALADPGDGQVFSHGGSDEGFEAFFFAYADGHGGAAIMTNGQRGGQLAQEIVTSLAAAYEWRFGAAEQRRAMALTSERAAEFAGEYVAKFPDRPDVTLIITTEGDKLWIEAPQFIPRQRFYVASETEVFAANSPILRLRTDDQGKPQAIEVNQGVPAERKK